MKIRASLLSVVVVGVLVGGSASRAGAQTLTPEFRSDIEKLLEITGAAATGSQMAGMVAEQVLAGQPNTPEKAVAVIKDVLTAEFAKALVGPDGLMPRLIAIYGKHFTHDDVREILKFYSTPVGRKLATSTPQLAADSAAAGQEWGIANVPRIMTVVQERLKAEGLVGR